MDSFFRQEFARLRDAQGAYPNWSPFLAESLRRDFETEVARDITYNGEVFKDRSASPAGIGNDEPALIKTLYRNIYDNCDGILTIENDDCWCISYQVPNQPGKPKRAIDLLGVRRDGTLAIFEAKVGNMGNTPLAALLESLDYAACLFRLGNQRKFLDGFDRWRSASGRKVPDNYRNTTPDFSRKPEVIVIGDSSYFATHARTIRSVGWDRFFKYLDNHRKHLPFHARVMRWNIKRHCATWYRLR